jgi:hypothetical protein
VKCDIWSAAWYDLLYEKNNLALQRCLTCLRGGGMRMRRKFS